MMTHGQTLAILGFFSVVSLVACVVARIQIAREAKRKKELQKLRDEARQMSEALASHYDASAERNARRLIAELRAEIASLPENPEMIPKQFPSDQCLFKYQLDAVDLREGKVSGVIMGRLPHIKGCPYCRYLLQDQDRNENGFWTRVFRKEE